ncbi:MAG: type I secretion system permease/ATPase [Hyphomicrobium sp.]|nr:type I secretion system permease/ATPase [Hyphomicrobium sp.]
MGSRLTSAVYPSQPTAGSSAVEHGAAEKAAVADFDPLVQWRQALRKGIFIVAIFSLFINLLMLTVPIYLFQLSDRVLTSRSIDTLIMLSILAAGLLAVLAILDILRKQILGRVATQLETTLGGPLLASVVTNAPIGDASNVQVIRGLHQVKAFVASSTMVLLFDAPLSPIYFAAVFLIHPVLGLIALLAGVVLTVLAILNQRATAKIIAVANGHASNAETRAEALTRNSQVINAMGMLNESVLQWGRAQADALTAQSAAQDKNALISGISKFARLLTQILILGAGAYLALSDQLTGGMMIAASVIAGRALQPLEGMIDGWKSVVQARHSYARVTAAVEALKNEKPRLRLPSPKGHLTADRLLYLPPGSKEPVINGISFELQAGESMAIVGPSGSGKSTLARILVGCLYPTAGKVRLDGTDLRHWDRRQFGEHTGFLPQEVELFPGTIKDNICRMRENLADEDIYRAAQLTGVHDLVTQMPNGYETVLDRNGAPLSGGQKQRLALARAFFGQPTFVVLDEPNSNLDAVGEQALTETLQRAKKQGVTCIVITQRPAILSIVSKLLILKNGRVEAFGPTATVLHHLVRDAGRVKASETVEAEFKVAG